MKTFEARSKVHNYTIRGCHGRVKKRGGRKTSRMSNDTPPKKGFWTPPRTVRFPPPSGVSAVSFFLYKHPRQSSGSAAQKLFWKGPKIIGRARSLVRFPPPIRFATISRPNTNACDRKVLILRSGGVRSNNSDLARERIGPTRITSLGGWLA